MPTITVAPVVVMPEIDSPGQVDRQPTGHAQHGPEQHHHEEPVAQPQFVAMMAHRQEQQKADDQRQPKGFYKRQQRTVTVNQGGDNRRYQGTAGEQHQ
jgi:hypothetical protein